MIELVDKQVNVQKESLKKLPGFTQNSRKPTKKCAMKMKERNKEKKTTGIWYMLRILHQETRSGSLGLSIRLLDHFHM